MGRAYLRNHGLAFSGFSGRWGGAVATVVRRTSRTLAGALYLLEPDDVERLDRFEGCPTSYRRCRRLVTTERGERRMATIYLQTRRPDYAPPSPSYFKTIMGAYRRFGFDENPLRLASWGLA